MMQTKMFSSFCNTEVTNKNIAGDDSLFNIPVDVHSRVSFSQFRNGLCTICMDVIERGNSTTEELPYADAGDETNFEDSAWLWQELVTVMTVSMRKYRTAHK